MEKEAAPGSLWQRDVTLLLLLFLLVGLLRVWLLTHTVVAARDSIGYIRYALEFERFHSEGNLDGWETWAKVLKKNHQHPGYPLTILAMSVPVRYVRAGIDPEGMRLSAQLASNLAALLLILPSFYMGKLLFDRQIGFWAALLFQFLPVTGHILSDGISEPIYLLLAVSALLFGMQGARWQSPVRLGLCGVFCGLSYLTRPEGALVLAATGLTILGMQLFASQRWSWPRLAAGAVALVVPAIALGALYVGATHRLTNKPSGQLPFFFGETSASADSDRVAVRPLLASVWASSIKSGGAWPDRVTRGTMAIGTEFAQNFHYLGAALAVVGWFWHQRRLRTDPAAWVNCVLCLLYVALLERLVFRESYVSDRHVQILVLTGCYFLAAALRDVPAALVRWSGLRISPGVATQAGLVLFVAVCLPKTLQPLHHHRAGHFAAGDWLAHHVQPGDIVADDHCWAHYYAGKVFEEGCPLPVQPGYQPVCYIVVARSRDPEVAQSRGLNEARIREADGQLVFRWPADKPEESAKVVVYSLPRERCQPFLQGSD